MKRRDITALSGNPYLLAEIIIVVNIVIKTSFPAIKKAG